MLFLLDTTVLIDYLRDAPSATRVDELMKRADIACATAINIEELVRGLRSDEESSVTDLVNGLVVIPLGVREGWQAGAWRRAFATRGITLSQGDCLIAAAAQTADATLATGNPKDFPMSEIRVEHWPVGS